MFCLRANQPINQGFLPAYVGSALALAQLRTGRMPYPQESEQLPLNAWTGRMPIPQNSERPQPETQ